MIIITGATGQLGGLVVQHVLDRVPAERVGVSARDVGKAQHLADRGVRVRQGSYGDPAALRDSFEGAERVLVVSSSDPAADHLALHRLAIETAVEAGAERVLYTSHQNVRPESAFFVAASHGETEAVLADSGVAWTSLRNGFYAHTLDWLVGPWQQTGVIAVPADGPVSWTDRADAAQAAAVVLVDGPPVEGPLTLTASSAVTFDDIAATASELTGREVRRVVVDDEQWIGQQIAQGTPEPAARMMLGLFLAARAGDFAGTDPLLGELLGREPRSVRDLLADRLAG